MEKSIGYNDAVLVYHTYGEGLPVILLHGFAETSEIWKNQIAYLSSFYKVVVPDLPGSGKSDLPAESIKNLSIEEFANAIHSILQSENIQECIMLGHSMGGYITLAFAEKYSEKLKAFGFVHSTAFADAEEKKQNRLKAIKMMEAYGSYAFLKTATPGLFADEFKQTHNDVVNELIEAGKEFKSISLQQYYYAMMQRPDRTNVFKNTKLPVLFVIGTEDNAVLLNDILQQVHLPEITYIHIIKNAGHMSMLETPDELNIILKNFCNACK